MSSKLLIVLGIIAAVGLGILIYTTQTAPLSTDAFVEPINISSDPIQTTDSETILPPLTYGNAKFFFTVKAKYKISGVLVSKKRYTNTHWSRLSPYDYAICWGDVPGMFPYVKFSQYGRFCHYRYKQSAPVAVEYLAQHMSNNHMIPSNLNIRRALKVAKKKELVEIEGYLVCIIANVEKHGTTNWNTSTIRTDTGNGACEILYITKLRIKDKVFE